MSAETRHDSRSVTKTTKIAKIAKKTDWAFFAVFVISVNFVAERGTSVVSAQAPVDKPTEAQQRPVFRGGTQFVRVDAYPAQDGRIVEGLTADDFEILEDGKPQRIESFDFIRFEGLSPDAERRDPISQQAGYDLAADPRYRLFVVYVDLAFSQSAGPFSAVEDLPRVQQPLINFFERVVGPQDLYGFLTSRNSVKDLVLAQKTAVTVSQIKDLWRAKLIDRDEADELLTRCGGIAPARARADATYTTLMDLVAQLGSLRQERKNLVLVTNLLPRWRSGSIAADRGAQLPRVGIERGRITGDDREIATNTRVSASGCAGEAQRLALMDFDQRFRELLGAAKRENVSFYTVTPGGLQAPPDQESTRAMRAAYDDLRSLADETDGIAVTHTNDLNAGFKRIADDLAAYYVLGYYTTNTNFDGRLRSIKVQLKANAAAGVKGGSIRARRQYRAPTLAEISAMSAAMAPSATRPAPVPTLVRKPVAFVIRGKTPPEPADLLRLSRTDRLRVEWKTSGTIDARSARILDRAGKPLAADVPLAEHDGRVVVELPLAPFARGDYTLELTIGSGSNVERSPLAFRIQ